MKREWYTSLLLPACWCPTTYYFTLDQIEAIQYIFNRNVYKYIYNKRERGIDGKMGKGKERKEQQITKHEPKKNFNFSMKISIHEVFNAFPAADIAFPPHPHPHSLTLSHSLSHHISHSLLILSMKQHSFTNIYLKKKTTERKTLPNVV